MALHLNLRHGPAVPILNFDFFSLPFWQLAEHVLQISIFSIVFFWTWKPTPTPATCVALHRWCSAASWTRHQHYCSCPSSTLCLLAARKPTLKGAYQHILCLNVHFIVNKSSLALYNQFYLSATISLSADNRYCPFSITGRITYRSNIYRASLKNSTKNVFSVGDTAVVCFDGASHIFYIKSNWGHVWEHPLTKIIWTVRSIACNNTAKKLQATTV